MREERAFSTELLGWGLREGGRRGQRAGDGTLQKRRGRWRNKREVAGGGRVCEGMRRRQTRCMSTHDVLLTEGFPS